MPGAGAGLVGRERELSTLDEMLGRLAGGTGGAVSISGEPGIGKSRLLEEAGRRAQERGALLFDGRASELERDFPFGVLVDALDPHLASLGPAALPGLGEEQRRLLGLVFPALTLPRDGALMAEERFRCHRAVRELLGVLAARRPVVLALDDLHWADAASLELLDHLLRRPPNGPVLLLLVHRASFHSGTLAQVSDRLRLDPLAREEADLLLGEEFSSQVRSDLYRDSGGNPFYLEQLTRQRRRPEPARGAPMSQQLDIEVPSGVRDALARELEQLDRPALRVLQGAAVVGDPFTPTLVADVAQESAEAVYRALDQAIAVDLLRPAETPAQFRFRHPIVRRGVYASAGQAWRVGAHARAAAAHARRGASPLARAHHVERSAVSGDPEAVATLTAAGRGAATVAPASAARWFAAALRLLADDAGPGERLALLGPLAAALGCAGRLRESRATGLQILDLLPVGAVAERLPVLGLLGQLDRLLGLGETGRLLEQTLAEVGERDHPEIAALELGLAADRYFPGDWAPMREHAERAHAAATRAGDRGLRATGAAMLGLADYVARDVDAARERRAETSALVDAPSPDEPPSLEAVDWLGWLEMSLEEYDAALAHFSRGLELARASGGGHLLAPMTFGLVLGSTWSGRLDDALVHSDASLELAGLLGNDRMRSWAVGLRTLLQLRRGALEDALAIGQEAQRLGDGHSSDVFFRVMGGWYGEVLVEAGQPARGREQILQSLGGAELPGVESGYRPYFYDVLAGAELALGRRDAAAEWALAAGEAARGLGLAGRRGAALHAQALAEEPVVGARLALAAADVLGVCQPIEAARSRILAGRHLAAAGDRDGALSELRRATTELNELGAAHYAAQAVRERRQLGERLGRGGRRRLAVSGLPSLSEREREVAGLVKDRLTNREIAARLVLSEKTVERHLSRIFVKLEARSRVEVARLLEAASATSNP